MCIARPQETAVALLFDEWRRFLEGLVVEFVQCFLLLLTFALAVRRAGAVEMHNVFGLPLFGGEWKQHKSCDANDDTCEV